MVKPEFVDKILPYPPNTSPLDHQVAGHFHGQGKTGLGFLKHANGLIYKPFQTSLRGEKEHAFYETIINELNDDDPIVLKLRTFLPGYYGVEYLNISNENIKFIKLQDLTANLSLPCVMDIKIGRETYEPGTSNDKVAYEIAKYPLVRKIGIRILGMKIFNPTTEKYEQFDKEYGKTLDENDIIECITKFTSCMVNKNDHKNTENTTCKEEKSQTLKTNPMVPCGGGDDYDVTMKKLVSVQQNCIATKTNVAQQMQIKLIDIFLDRLNEIHEWFEQQTAFRFFASSLLFIYDADYVVVKPLTTNIENNLNCNDGDKNMVVKENENIPSLNAQIKMIDFTHVLIDKEKLKFVCDINPSNKENRDDILPSKNADNKDFNESDSSETQLDNNYVFGLTYLINVFKTVKNNIEHC